MTRRELEKLAEKSAKERKIKKEKSIELLEAEAKLLDKARSVRRRERKTPTKEELALENIKRMLEYREDTTAPVKLITPKKDSEEWDVKIGDPIEFFDPNLSYEITGYRPITKDRGLDFDPKLFTVAADSYRRNGRYTSLLPGTFAHRSYWNQEFKRCRDGVTIGKYTLTGENYFFINYYRLLSVFAENGEEARNEDFPGFLAKQYEYFHYLELCRKAGFDACAFKARGVNKPALH